MASNAAADLWLRTLDETIRRLIQNLLCQPGPSQVPADWLGDLNSCWSSNGLPAGLTDSGRKQMLCDLNEFEALLYERPEEFEAGLLNTTFGTISSMRAALQSPVPTPAGPRTVFSKTEVNP